MPIQTAIGYVGRKVVFNINNVPEEFRNHLSELGLKSGRSYKVLEEHYVPASIPLHAARNLEERLQAYDSSVFTISVNGERKHFDSRYFDQKEKEGGK